MSKDVMVALIAGLAVGALTVAGAQQIQQSKIDTETYQRESAQNLVDAEKERQQAFEKNLAAFEKKHAVDQVAETAGDTMRFKKIGKVQNCVIYVATYTYPGNTIETMRLVAVGTGCQVSPF